MAAHATENLARIPAEWALKQSGLDKVTEKWQLNGSFILDEIMLGITRDDSISLTTSINGQNYTTVQVARSYRKLLLLHSTLLDKAQISISTVASWQYFSFLTVSLLSWLQQDLCLAKRFLENVFDKDLMPDSVGCHSDANGSRGWSWPRDLQYLYIFLVTW